MKTLRTGITSVCFALVGLVGLVGACKQDSGTVKAVQLGEAVTLKIDDAAKVGEELVVTFKAVTSDSRCPQGTQCVTAGDAAVVLTVKAGEKAEDLTVNVGAAAENKVRTEPFMIRILKLDPYPTEGQTIQDAERSIELRVDRTAE
jgi:hypothetical protein